MNAPVVCNLALIQMEVTAGDPGANLSRAGLLIREAKGQEADIALLPEAMTIGWTHSRSRDLAEPIPEGTSCRNLSSLARELGIYICAGIIERAGERVFNSAVLINREGEVILHHRKLNELEIASEYYETGDHLGVVETEFGRIGLMICADGFADGQCITRTLGYMGAGLILSPSAWAVEATHDNSGEPYGALWINNYGPVARDFRLWVAACSNVGPIFSGPWQGRKCIGSSLLMNPKGEVEWQSPYGQEHLSVHRVKMVQRPTRGTGWSSLFGRPQS